MSTLIRHRTLFLFISAVMIALGGLTALLIRSASWGAEQSEQYAHMTASCFAAFAISSGVFGLVEAGHAKYGMPQSMHVLRTIAAVFMAFSFVGIVGGAARVITG